MKFYLPMAIVVIALFAPLAAMADDDPGPKELIDVASGPQIDKAYECGSLFKITEFGGTTDKPHYLLYRRVGENNNSTSVANVAPPVIDETLKKPMGERLADRRILFRMNSASYKEAAACLPKSVPAAPSQK
jgi:hypothetical protein